VNREELDAWFAEADDVLADWCGSPDAAKWPPREVFENRTSPPTRPEAMEHALRLWQERNTGPAPRVGLDGRRRRRC
jgi:hypothetical protein